MLLASNKEGEPLGITAIIIAMSIPSAFTGFCFWWLERNIQKRDEKAKAERAKREAEIDRRDVQRKKYELCQLNMIMATMTLAETTAKAVERIPDAHCNGDMHSALDYAQTVKNEQRDFLKEQAVNHIDF